MVDAVNHPEHYGDEDDPYECIKVLEAWLTPEQFSGFLIGNYLKYLNRARKKGCTLTDMKKAQWYLSREIARLEKEFSTT